MDIKLFQGMKKFLIYILKKLLYAFWVILGATFMIFLLFNVVMGDPTVVLLGKYATPEAKLLLREQLGLDRSWYVQYWEVLKSAFTFQFGYSWSNKQNILNLLKEGMVVSLTVTLPGFIIVNILLISIALLMVRYRGSSWDRWLVVFFIVMSSIPLLVYVLFMQKFFAFKLGLFPITGYERGFPNFLPYVLLPIFIDVWIQLCSSYRFFRNIMLEEAYHDYVRTALAKGLGWHRVLFKHILRNALIPIVTCLVQGIPGLIFGAVILENFFSIPGLGNIVINAINTCDFPTIKAATIISAVFGVVFNILGDILYRLIDPRIN